MEYRDSDRTLLGEDDSPINASMAWLDWLIALVVGVVLGLWAAL